MSISEQVPVYEQQTQEGLALPDEKHFYFNGYTILITGVDVNLVLRKNDKPIAFINTPHSVAKTLAIALNQLLDNFEKKTGRPIPTLEELEKSAPTHESPK